MVRSGQFVEMRELLADNISLVQQLEAVQSSSPLPMVGPARPRLREVSTLSTRLYCFLAYSAITTTDPRTQDQLAYAPPHYTGGTPSRQLWLVGLRSIISSAGRNRSLPKMEHPSSWPTGKHDPWKLYSSGLCQPETVV